MRREAVPMKVKEAVVKLKNKSKTIRDFGQTSGLAKINCLGAH